MRLAIFSDLHGNPYAVKAVLEAVQKEAAEAGALDTILAAGDLCLGGSDPGRTLDLLFEAGVEAVYGNTEVYLRDPDYNPPDELHQKMWPIIQPATCWTRDHLTPVQQTWLFGLPFERRFSPTGKAEDELVVVHANPKDVEGMIFPAEAEQRQLWGEVRQPDTAPDLTFFLADERARVVVFGHFHHTFQRDWNGKTLVDVACCSLPGIDRDLRARYTLCEWSGNGWSISPRWVAYDISEELAALQASDMPGKDHFGRYFLV